MRWLDGLHPTSSSGPRAPRRSAARTMLHRASTAGLRWHLVVPASPFSKRLRPPVTSGWGHHCRRVAGAHSKAGPECTTASARLRAHRMSLNDQHFETRPTLHSTAGARLPAHRVTSEPELTAGSTDARRSATSSRPVTTPSARLRALDGRRIACRSAVQSADQSPDCEPRSPGRRLARRFHSQLIKGTLVDQPNPG